MWVAVKPAKRKRQARWSLTLVEMGGVEPWNSCLPPFISVHHARIFLGSCLASVHGSSSESAWVTLSVAVSGRTVEERSSSSKLLMLAVRNRG